MTKRRDTTYTLSLDGGGGKICFSTEWLKIFYQLRGGDPTKIYKDWDVVAGTSAGGIVACAIGVGKSLDEIIDYQDTHLKWIFTIRSAVDIILGSNDATFPSNRPDKAQKAYILGNNDQWYRSVSEVSNYGSARLKSALTELFGDMTMQDLKTSVIIPSYNYTQKKSVVFSNLNYAEFTGQNETLVNVALATSAAPLNLPRAILANGIPPVIQPGDAMVDGGIYQNNPATTAHNWATIIKPRARRHCILSTGTGKDDPSPKDEENPADDTPLPPFSDGLDSIRTYFNASIESAANDDNLSNKSKYAVGNFYYYRADAQLDSVNFNTNLDNTDADFIDYLKATAQSRINADMDNVSQFIGHLDT